MSTSRATHSVWSLNCLYTILLIVAIGACLVPTYEGPIPFTDDAGTSFAVARGVLGGELPLSGQPSHIQGRHPGPVYYLMLSALLFITGGSTLSVVQVLFFLKLLALVSCVLLVNKLSKRRILPALVGAGLCLASGGYSAELTIPWVNHFLLLPTALYLWSVYALLRFGLALFPLCLVAASLLAQTFFGTLPFIAGSLAVSLGALLLGRREKAFILTHRLIVPLGLVLLLVVWCLPLLYELKYESNLWGLFSIADQSSKKTASLYEAISVLSEYFAWHLSPVYLDLWSHSNFLFSLAVFSSALLLWFFLKAVFRREGNLGYFLAALLLGAFFTFLSVLFVKAPVHHFYFHSLLPLPLIFFSLVMGELGSEIQGFIKLGFSKGLPKVFEPIAAVVLIGLSLASALRGTEQNRSSHFLRTPTESLAHAQEIARAINFDRKGSTRFRIFIQDTMRQRRSAIYYHLGPGFENRVTYAKRFLELPSFQASPVKAEFAYLLDCSASDKMEQLPSKWRVHYELALPSDGKGFCRDCRLFRLRRSPD